MELAGAPTDRQATLRLAQGAHQFGRVLSRGTGERGVVVQPQQVHGSRDPIRDEVGAAELGQRGAAHERLRRGLGLVTRHPEAPGRVAAGLDRLRGGLGADHVLHAGIADPRDHPVDPAQQQGGVAQHQVLEMIVRAPHRDHRRGGPAGYEVALPRMQGADLGDRRGERVAQADGRVLGAAQQVRGQGVGVPGDAVVAAGAESLRHPGPVEHHRDLAEHSGGVLVGIGNGGGGERGGVHAATVGGLRPWPGRSRP